MLIKLGEYCTNVQVGVCLDLGPLQTGLNGQSLLEEVECGTHLPDSSIVTSHIIESHCHAQFVGLAQLLRLLEQIQGTINILFFEIVDGKNIANFAQLFARSRELYR
jgi:hypothetical protein